MESPGIPILAISDVVLGTELPGGGVPLADFYQEKSVVSIPGQDLASSSRDMEVVSVADYLSIVLVGILEPPFEHLRVCFGQDSDSQCGTFVSVGLSQACGGSAGSFYE